MNDPRIRAYQDSIIALKTQLVMQLQMEREGTKRFGGVLIASAIKETANCLLNDINGLESIDSPSNWTNEKRAFAQKVANDYAHITI